MIVPFPPGGNTDSFCSACEPHVQKLPYAMESFRYVCLTYFAPYVLIAGPRRMRRR